MTTSLQRDVLRRKQGHGFDFKDFGFPSQLKNTHHRSGSQLPGNEKRPLTKIVGMWQKCGNRTVYLFSTFSGDFLKQFYIKYSRRGTLSVHVRIKKGGGGVGGGKIFADVLLLSFFPMKIERSAKDSGSTFASKSCALTRKQLYTPVA